MRFGRHLESFAPRWNRAVLLPISFIIALLGIVGFYHPRVGELAPLAIVLTMWIPRSWTTLLIAALAGALPAMHVSREMMGRSHAHLLDDAVTLSVVIMTAFAVLYRKRMVARAQRSITRMREQQFDLVRLAAEPAIVNGDVAAAARAVSEVAARFVGVERASVWLLSDDRATLTCLDLFCAETRQHHAGQALNAADFPRYFEALTSGRAIDAGDARIDPRTAEFLTVYLKPLGVHAMLDAAIRVGGEVVGAVCHEDCQGKREWNELEVAGATELAAQMAHAILNHRRRLAESALRESEHRFRQLAEHISNSVFWLSAADNHQTFYVSPSYGEIWGRSVEDLYRSPGSWLKSVHPEDRARVEMARPLQVLGRYDIEFRIIRPDGTLRWIRDRAFPVMNERGEVYRLSGVAEDITFRKEQSQAIEASEKKYRDLVETSNDLIWAVDVEGRWTFVNRKAARRIYGYEPEEMLGRSFVEFLAPEVVASDLSAFAEIKSGKSVFEYETVHIRKDGQRVHLSFNAIVRRAEDGSVLGATGTASDITLRRESEDRQRELEAQLLHAQKMDALGQLAGGIAHDFNNILTSILGYVELMRTKFAHESGVQKCLEPMTTSIHRARGVVRQILTFSRRSERVLERVQLVDVMVDVSKLLQVSLPAGVELEVSTGCHPLILGDANQCFQLLMNLCTNGLHAMRACGGVLRLAVAPVKVERLSLMRRSVLGRGAYVCLSVIDSGAGMSEDVKKRLFEPFFTTKPVGEGTGLGLAVVHGIVESHGGRIFVESAEGRGSRFDVYLPALELNAPALAPLEIGAIAANGPLPQPPTPHMRLMKSPR